MSRHPAGKPSKPSCNRNKKPVSVDRALPRRPSVDDVVEPDSGTLQEHFNVVYLRRIVPILTLECITRIGNKWHDAHNKTLCASMMRAVVPVCFDNNQRLAQKYDRLTREPIRRGLNSKSSATFSSAASTHTIVAATATSLHCSDCGEPFRADATG
jgi:hypothetical protein